MEENRCNCIKTIIIPVSPPSVISKTHQPEACSVFMV